MRLSIKTAIALVAIVVLGGCTLLMPHIPVTRGTWTGSLSRGVVSRNIPEYLSAPVMIFTVTDGPPMKIYKCDPWEPAYTRDTKGLKFILVDRKHQLYLVDHLTNKTITIKGTLNLTENPFDPVSRNFMGRPNDDTNGAKLGLIEAEPARILLKNKPRSN
jgi:hypothetical protein